MLPMFLMILSLLSQAPTAAKHKGADTALATRIDRLFHITFSTDDEKEQAVAGSAIREIYAKHGLPTVADVGDEPVYQFVVLLASDNLPIGFRARLLPKIKEAEARRELPPDAATFYEARLRLAKAKQLARTRAPTNPHLRDEIERLVKIDQALRQQKGFNIEKMTETDRRNAAPLQTILDKYGIPTYPMVGPQAAFDFVIMIQHQSPHFRELGQETTLWRGIGMRGRRRVARSPDR